MSLQLKTFRIATPSLFADESESRWTRRIHLTPAVLKESKLQAGDLAAIIKAESKTSGVDENQRPVAFAVGVLWPSYELEDDQEIDIHPTILESAHLSSTSTVHVLPLPAKPLQGKAFPPALRQVVSASSILLEEVAIAPESTSSLLARKVAGWADAKDKTRDWLSLLVKEVLVDLKHITHSLVLDVPYEGRTRRFVLSSDFAPVSTTTANSTSTVKVDLSTKLDSMSISDTTGKSRNESTVWTVNWNTTVSLTTLDDMMNKSKSKPSSGIHGESAIHELHSDGPENRNEAYASVGGLDAQVQQVRDLLEIPLTRPELFRHYGLKPPRGILLHGPPGTGKTHLARAIAASTKASVLIVNGPELSGAYHGETEARLRAVFEDARRKSPCIVVLDELDALCPARSDASGAGGGGGGGGSEVEQRVVATLLTILDGFSAEESSANSRDDGKEDRVVVVATTNRPNAIDPALRRPGRLDKEIEIGVPDTPARTAILRVLLAKTPHTLNAEDMISVASLAHGYVGADLGAVVREAGTAVIKRWTSTSSTIGGGTTTNIGKTSKEHDHQDEQPPALTVSDLLAALPLVRPSALRTFLASGGAGTPVRYADIGGLGATIQKLQECVEWPLRHPEAFSRLGVQPPRGVLLYGPPGCSKTMLVRALAHESGVNFVSIKGPELLSKYVGDSERSVRTLFLKARELAPCILFFDEIDALATSRSSASSQSSSSEGMLISLLTEMDGVQELRAGVTVVAATNRPEVIDSALMRPGRLDRLIYVGPPDAQGREEIFRIRTKSMSIAPDVDISVLVALTEGCSGAEIMAICQEAAMLTMQADINAPHVTHDAFVSAAKGIRKQITPEVISQYERWRDQITI